VCSHRSQSKRSRHDIKKEKRCHSVNGRKRATCDGQRVAGKRPKAKRFLSVLFFLIDKLLYHRLGPFVGRKTAP
jgi:hypothetical protein